MQSYITHLMADGAVVIQRTTAKRRQGFWPYFLFGAFSTSILLLLAGGSGTCSTPDDGFAWENVRRTLFSLADSSAFGIWLSVWLVLFLLWSVSFLVHAVGMFVTREDWYARPGLLEVRHHFLRVRYRVQRYSGRVLRVARYASHDVEGDAAQEVTGYSWSLHMSNLERDGLLSRRYLDCWITKPSEVPHELLATAETLAAATGWRLFLPDIAPDLLPLTTPLAADRRFGR